MDCFNRASLFASCKFVDVGLDLTVRLLYGLFNERSLSPLSPLLVEGLRHDLCVS